MAIEEAPVRSRSSTLRRAALSISRPLGSRKKDNDAVGLLRLIPILDLSAKRRRTMSARGCLEIASSTNCVDRGSAARQSGVPHGSFAIVCVRLRANIRRKSNAWMADLSARPDGGQ